MEVPIYNRTPSRVETSHLEETSFVSSERANALIERAGVCFQERPIENACKNVKNEKKKVTYPKATFQLSTSKLLLTSLLQISLSCFELTFQRGHVITCVFLYFFLTLFRRDWVRIACERTRISGCHLVPSQVTAGNTCSELDDYPASLFRPSKLSLLLKTAVSVI